MSTPEGAAGANNPKNVLEKLCDPFPLSLVKWLIVDKNKTGTRGKLLAYVDPRAYIDRLNNVIGVDGWSESYSVTALEGISRQRDGRVVASGKIFVVCTLRIDGLGTRSGTGERWGDDRNAMTEADAQALKRACSRFGLGRYLYNLGPVVVPLDRDGHPIMVPELPQWAWPQTDRTMARLEPQIVHKSENGQAFMDVAVTHKIETFRQFIGNAIYTEILKNAGHCESARGIPTHQRQIHVLRMMQTAANLAGRIKTLTRRLGTHQLIAEMEELDLQSVADIPSFETLARLAQNLETIAARRAA
jgi:hypothetical protein